MNGNNAIATINSSIENKAPIYLSKTSDELV